MILFTVVPPQGASQFRIVPAAPFAPKVGLTRRQIAERGLVACAGAGPGAELAHGLAQRLRTAAVAQGDVVTCFQKLAGQGLRDVAGADKSDLRDVFLPMWGRMLR